MSNTTGATNLTSAIKKETLVASPSTLRSLASTIRKNGFDYTIKRVEWKNFNSTWKGMRGLALDVSHEAYQSLYK